MRDYLLSILHGTKISTFMTNKPIPTSNSTPIIDLIPLKAYPLNLVWL